MTFFTPKASGSILSFRRVAIIGLCFGASVFINGAATRPAMGDSSCWDVVFRACCSTVSNFSFDCGGSPCTSISIQNDSADYKNVFASGWGLTEFDRQTTYCKFFQAICNYTVSAPTCIHDDELTIHSCVDYNPPPGGPTCP